MAARPTWKGVLQISLVTIPIKVFPATESSSGLSFNQLHQDCTTRIQQKKWCPTCAREVPTSEIVKGFEFEKGKYVILLEAELEAVQPPSTKVIDLVQFAEASALDPVSIDRSYYLAPDGPAAGEAFAVMSAALVGTVGVGKLGIYGREFLVAVRAWGALLLLHTLHHAAEIRPADQIDDVGARPRATIDQVTLARQVIDAIGRTRGRLDLADYTDAYRADLQRLIDAKVAGQEIVVPIVEAPGAVLNLKAALELSLAAVRATKPTPAKATPAKRKKAS
jgi:DNA end-binding protein Ku